MWKKDMHKNINSYLVISFYLLSSSAKLAFYYLYWYNQKGRGKINSYHNNDVTYYGQKWEKALRRTVFAMVMLIIY